MIRVSMEFDDEGLADSLDGAAARSQARLGLAVHRAGSRTRTQVRANASGRPGPNVQTGDYRRSISHTPTREGDEPVSYVHTNSPQARRLEFGFNGTDALGRQHRQPPRPHFGPAAEKAEGFLAQEIEKVIAETLNDMGDPA